MVNTLKIPPFLMESGRIDNWINFIVFIMDHELDQNDLRLKPTTKTDEIEQLDKNDYWKLKGICAKVSVKLYSKFKDDYNIISRKISGKKKDNTVG